MNKIYLLSPWVEERYIDPETSLGYIKYYLVDNGYQAEIINCAQYDRDLNEVIAKLKEDERPVIGVTGYTRERFHAYDLIRRVRKDIPGSLIVVGGRHFGFLPEETLRELPEVDIVVRGEGEITFKEICDSVRDNAGYAGIPGLSYRDGKEVIHNPDRPVERDINRFRSYDKNELDKKIYLANSKLDKKNLYFSIYTTRGCPYNCVYCSLGRRQVRFRSIDSIIEEIGAKIDTTGIRNIRFDDSSLTYNKKFITALCEKIIERKLNIRWHCYSRVNVDISLLKLMKKAGMVSAAVGLESGSPRVLEAISKRINLDQVENFCKEAHSLGIKLYLFCMISLPGETREDVDVTINFVKRMSKYVYSAGMQTTRILPDTALYKIALEKNILPGDFNWFRPYKNDDRLHIASPLYRTLPFYTEHLTPEDIREKMDDFGAQCTTKFIYFNTTLRRVLRENFRVEAWKNMTPRIFARKTMNALKLVVTAYNNKHKEAYFN
ncbi:MAG: radical SAM protein [Nitrospirae bacterium]|nr:radical SAM protein [Nitrospirota bacterium]